MNPGEAAEMEQLARQIGTLLDGLGGPIEITDYQVQHFRAVLDGDDEAAARARRRTEVLAASLAAGSELLSVYDRALVLRNIPLARATFAGVVDLVVNVVARDLEAELAALTQQTPPPEEEEPGAVL